MLEDLSTEKSNPKTMSLDEMSTSEILSEMNTEDALISRVVGSQLRTIKKVVDDIVYSLNNSGRLVYIGAGTSGRLGVLDAVECEPTFGAGESEIIALIAGGPQAMFHAQEGAEDSEALGREDLKKINLTEMDTVVGITASGRTPYVIGAINYAKEINASLAGITCNRNTEIAKITQNCVELNVGPEILTGSTRLKAGSAQKMVLNMLSTVSMIKVGKVYGNLMVDLHATNEKLIDRAIRIIKDTTGVSSSVALSELKKANGSTKVAIVALLRDISPTRARELIEKNGGFIRGIVR
ncbi:N-acetylmuramic acid 6-phosphate etherase [Lapidilactobacillus achengensis]|uniref:N-acetylmuramic acid 6-phosphate etherase n=1 Tax=Lapidilactobacillus achengensis TaxID=2486000 RepID=A0ABW1UMZ1_9LACO|nr:N-acetylmuramic acid 6-phosphate etherase [Lapidilactobacillus achengensis]